MRPSFSRDLVMLILAVAICRSTALGGPKAKRPAGQSPEEGDASVVKRLEEKGYGLTDSLARANALESLRGEVANWLSTAHPEIAYTPTVADMGKLGLEFTAAEPWQRPNDNLPAGLKEEQVLEVTLKAEMTAGNVAYFARQARTQVTHQRQGILARGLTGAVGLLVVATGYLRLHEKAGRHRRKLDVAAVAAVALVGLALLAIG
jgi:hypothetical protein